MKKTLLSLAVIVPVLSAAALPWWFGLETEKAFRALLKAGDERSGLSTEIVRYQRGWLSASAETLLRHPTLPLALHARHDIHHGPLPLGKGSMGLQLTRVESRLSLQTSEARLREEIDSLPPIQAITTVDLDGRGVMHLEQPAWTRPGAPTLTWDGLRGEIRFDRDWKNLQSDVRMPGARLSVERVDVMRIDNIHLTSNLRQGAAGIYLGDNALTLERFTLRPPSRAMPVELHGLSASSQTRASGPDTIDITVRYTLREARLEGERHGPGELLFELRRLDAAALHKFEKQMQQTARQGVPLEQASLMMVGKSLELLGVLARRSPEFEIKRLSLHSERGELTGRAKLVIDGSRSNIAENPLLLLTAVRGDAELHVPAGYVRPLLAPIIRQDFEALGRARRVGREDVKSLSLERLNTIIDQAMPHYLARHPLTRYLVADGQHFRLQATLQRGELLINGQPWSGGAPLPLAMPGP